MSTNTNYLVKISENHANKVIEFILLFLNSIILARYLGPSAYGIYGIFITFITLFSSAFSLGYEQLLNVYVIKSTEEIKKYLCIYLFKRRVMLFIIITPVILGILGLLYYIEAISPNTTMFVLIAIPYLVFFSFNNYWQKFFIADLHTRICFKLKLFYLLLTITSNYFALKNEIGLQLLLVINILIMGINFILWQRYFYRYYNRANVSPSYNINYKFGYESWAYELLELALSKHMTTIFLIYYSISTKEIGYFNLAINISIIFQLMLIGGFDGVGLTIFSKISSDKTKLVLAWNAVSKFITVVTMPLIILTILYAKHFVLSFYGSEYSNGIILVQLFLIFFVFMRIFGGGIHITILYAIEDSKTALKYKIISVCIAVIFNIVLVGLFGIIGAIVSMGFVQALFLMSMMLITQRKLKAKYSLADQVKILFISIIPALPLYLLKDSNLMVSIVAIPVYLTLVSLLLVLIKPFDKNEIEMVIDKIPFMKKSIFLTICALNENYSCYPILSTRTWLSGILSCKRTCFTR